jgi:hypothetical protein
MNVTALCALKYIGFSPHQNLVEAVRFENTTTSTYLANENVFRLLINFVSFLIMYLNLFGSHFTTNFKLQHPHKESWCIGTHCEFQRDR